VVLTPVVGVVAVDPGFAVGEGFEVSSLEDESGFFEDDRDGFGEAIGVLFVFEPIPQVQSPAVAGAEGDAGC